MAPSRILITRTDRIGDVVLSTPVIRFFRKNYPDAYIAFMVRPYTKDIVKDNPDLDEVVVYDKDHYQKGLLSTIKFALALRKKKFDTAVALHPTNRVHIMFFIAGITSRIGYDRNLPFLLTRKVTHLKQEGNMHEAEYNFDFLKKAGFDTEGADKRPYIRTAEEEKSLVDAVFKDNDICGEIISVHAGASCPSKRWPPEKFAKVCDELAGSSGHEIVLLGGEDAVSFSRKVKECMKNAVHDLTDVLRLGELAEVLRRSKIFISNDSGPVHMATAVGTPVISIFGRKDAGLSPKRWGPVGEKDTYIHKDAGCIECLAHNCDKGFACLELVSADEVIDVAKRIINAE